MQKEKLIKLLKNKKPIKYSETSEIYEIENFIVKIFKYKNFFEQLCSLKGLRSFLFSNILIKKDINAPIIKIYHIGKNFEIIGYDRIEGEELTKKLKKNKNNKIFNEMIEKLKDFTEELFNKNIYHKDYDPTNIIINDEGKLYLIDLENVSYFLTEKRKKKMLSKMNRILKIDFNISINIL